MTSNFGLPIITLLLADAIFTVKNASIINCGITLGVIMHIFLVSKAMNQFGIFRWNCIFCGKPNSGSMIKMLTDICNHEG